MSLGQDAVRAVLGLDVVRAAHRVPLSCPSSPACQATCPTSPPTVQRPHASPPTRQPAHQPTRIGVASNVARHVGRYVHCTQRQQQRGATSCVMCAAKPAVAHIKQSETQLPQPLPPGTSPSPAHAPAVPSACAARQSLIRPRCNFGPAPSTTTVGDYRASQTRPPIFVPPPPPHPL